MSGPPRRCASCAKPVARKTLRFCFDCLPGGPYPPPPCRRCGTSGDYFSAGLCSRCHQYAPQSVDSCRDCHAWGVTRTHKWLCHACIVWRENYPDTGRCRICHQQRHVSRREVCRLCWRQGSDARAATQRERPYKPLDVVAANRNGQQLFLANLGRRRHPRRPRAKPSIKQRLRPVAARQLDLFETLPDTWASRRGLPEPSRTKRSAALDALMVDHAERHGWAASTRKRTRLALRVLATGLVGPTAPIRASDVLALADKGLTVKPVLEMLSAAGLLDDDRVPAIVTWFEHQVTGLPTAMTEELQRWFDVLHLGSKTSPRSRPRADVTIRTRTFWALPVLRAWADSGHQSLREISRVEVVAALPPSGNPRATTVAGLRSIFGTLKAHKVLFTNPMARLAGGEFERRQPLALPVVELRAALEAEDPVRAALAALLAFHGLRHEELRNLKLVDLRDGRLHLDRRTVLLAQPVRQRMGAWLDYRSQRWPNTANPHLFIHLRTASGTGPIGHTWVGRRVGIPARALRDDRILDEVNATDGDIRRICDLFGLGVTAAVRYVDTLDHRGLSQGEDA